MTRAECGELLAPLVIAFRQEWDKPTWTVWFNRLKHEAVPVVKAAVDAVTSEDRAFPPTPGELLAECARQREKLTAPFTPCELCDHTGWRELEQNGVSRARRCDCYHDWQARLVEAGLVEPKQLTAAG